MTHPPPLSTTFPPTPDRSEAGTPISTTSKLTQNALTQASFTPPTLHPLTAADLTITLTKTPAAVPPPNSPAVWSQKVHTDHMLTCTWSAISGWSTPSIHPFGPLTLSPMCSALHYATECFEGMKAYRGHDGRLRLFRPQRNCERMLRSATRIALPAFEPAELQKLIERFVALEGKRWLPDGEEEGQRGSFLYLRPTMIGTGNALGVQQPTEALLFLVAVCFPALDEPHKAPTALPEPPLSLPSISTISNTTTTTTSSKQGMRLLASQHSSIRAWPGGIGHAKVGANYGPSLPAQHEARQLGYDQILWLFGPEGFITEAGASNFFVLWRTPAPTMQEDDGPASRGAALQLVTAPLADGLILEGVTRASILQLVRKRCAGDSSSSSLFPGGEAIEVVERPFTMAEVLCAAREGRLVEAFGCGTAFFVAPVQEIHFRGVDVDLPLKSGSKPCLAHLVKRWLSEIMFGGVQHEWGSVVDEDQGRD